MQLGHRADNRRLRDGFNPHPAFRPDATAWSFMFQAIISRFQSSSGLSTGCNMQGQRTLRQRREGFNPHPAFRPDATENLGEKSTDRQLFQSSSGLSTGCNTDWPPNMIGKAMFQSSSGLSTGCNRAKRHGPRRHPKVSILIRPFDRMQHPGVDEIVRRFVLFQSSSGLSTGCNTGTDRTGSLVVTVSILIRPFDRMQRGQWRLDPVRRMFQSSSGLSTGCNAA